MDLPQYPDLHWQERNNPFSSTSWPLHLHASGNLRAPPQWLGRHPLSPLMVVPRASDLQQQPPPPLLHLPPRPRTGALDPWRHRRVPTDLGGAEADIIVRPRPVPPGKKQKKTTTPPATITANEHCSPSPTMTGTFFEASEYNNVDDFDPTPKRFNFLLFFDIIYAMF